LPQPSVKYGVFARKAQKSISNIQYLFGKFSMELKKLIVQKSESAEVRKKKT